MQELTGKTIKDIDEAYYDGCIFSFTDGTRYIIRSTTYPDGSYNDLIIEQMSEKDYEIYEQSKGEL